jgi:hypothetical protein
VRLAIPHLQTGRSRPVIAVGRPRAAAPYRESGLVLGSKTVIRQAVRRDLRSLAPRDGARSPPSALPSDRREPWLDSGRNSGTHMQMLKFDPMAKVFTNRHPNSDSVSQVAKKVGHASRTGTPSGTDYRGRKGPGMVGRDPRAICDCDLYTRRFDPL